jgi:hypothetical protein
MTVTEAMRNPQNLYDGYMSPDTCLCVDDLDPATLLVDFLNTVDVDEGTDVLDDEDAWKAWVGGHGLGPVCGETEDPEDLGEIRALRDDLRCMAMGEGDCSVDVPVTVRMEGGRVTLGGKTPRGVIAAAAARLAVEDRLGRVKICPADDCRWAFYDTSKNQSRQWCSMKVCGNRAKARSHRERVAAG